MAAPRRPEPRLPDPGRYPPARAPLGARLARALRRLANRIDPPKLTINVSAGADPVATGRAIEAALLRYKKNGGRA